MEKLSIFAIGSMRAKENIYRYVMLLAGIVLLVSVVVPHHHHSNGLPCYRSLTAEASHDGHDGHDGHDCGCNGHNIALYTSLLSHATHVEPDQFLFPLLILFDYINPPVPLFYKLLFENERACYIESLHGAWIISASGLRAPPYEGKAWL